MYWKKCVIGSFIMVNSYHPIVDKFTRHSNHQNYDSGDYAEYLNALKLYKFKEYFNLKDITILQIKLDDVIEPIKIKDENDYNDFLNYAIRIKEISIRFIVESLDV